MSVQNIEAFYKQVLKNPALANGLDTATDTASFGRIAAEMGEAAGFKFSAEEAGTWICEKLARQADGELDDEELEAVAGGKVGIPSQLTSLVSNVVKDALHQVQNGAAAIQAEVISRNTTNPTLGH
jgi:predicted ribosomally synthesized peptide with nif11-like leader